MTKTADRFWDKVDIGSREECWVWKASVGWGVSVMQEIKYDDNAKTKTREWGKTCAST
jgi:hypothetical protein